MGLEVIDKLKKSKGLTNEELAKLSGVPKATIDKITAGATKDPKLELEELVYKIAPTAEFSRTMLAEEFRQSESSDENYTSDFVYNEDEE